MKIDFFNLVIVIFMVCQPIYGTQGRLVFDSKQLVVVPNVNGVGGQLVFSKSQGKILIYSYDRTIDFSVSPDKKKIAVVDLAGSASSSIVIIHSDLSQTFLDSEIYRQNQNLTDYSSVYFTIRKWASSDVILINIEAYGPYSKNIKSNVKFEFKLKIMPIKGE